MCTPVSHMIQNHVLELIERDLMMMVDLMLVHDLLDLLMSQVMAHFCEGFAKGHVVESMSAVSIKFLEEGL